MTDRELMQQALDSLEYVIQSVGGNAPESFDVWFQKTQVPAEALRARLAQPKREWQGLTDEEITACIQMGKSGYLDGFVKPLATSRAVEAKLKEKNGF